jgi:Pyruvate/2-oxoacid:ferredoxin oxidoreductase delta subunit
MCQFCTKHGEGKRWYLSAKNYSEDLVSDLGRRKMITEFFGHPEVLADAVGRLKRLDQAPAFVRRVLGWRISNRMKKVHFGQVVPIEEVGRILDFVTSVVRLPCVCRRATLKSEQRYCYGISMGPQGGRMMEIIREIDPGYLLGPDNTGLEILTKEEALEAMRGHEREGLCHTVWTFVPPFIGGICNCDRSDCLAMRATVTHSVPVMFRAEYLALADEDLCDGCRNCMRLCQFGAMGYSAARKKVEIDPRRCYGCGICRALCKKDAITLRPRSEDPVAARTWL